MKDKKRTLRGIIRSHVYDTIKKVQNEVIENAQDIHSIDVTPIVKPDLTSMIDIFVKKSKQEKIEKQKFMKELKSNIYSFFSQVKQGLRNEESTNDSLLDDLGMSAEDEELFRKFMGDDIDSYLDNVYEEVTSDDVGLESHNIDIEDSSILDGKQRFLVFFDCAMKFLSCCSNISSRINDLPTEKIKQICEDIYPIMCKQSVLFDCDDNTLDVTRRTDLVIALESISNNFNVNITYSKDEQIDKLIRESVGNPHIINPLYDKSIDVIEGKISEDEYQTSTLINKTDEDMIDIANTIADRLYSVFNNSANLDKTCLFMDLIVHICDRIFIGEEKVSLLELSYHSLINNNDNLNLFNSIKELILLVKNESIGLTEFYMMVLILFSNNECEHCSIDINPLMDLKIKKIIEEKIYTLT